LQLPPESFSADRPNPAVCSGLATTATMMVMTELFGAAVGEANQKINKN